MNDLDHLEYNTNIEILTSILLAYLRYVPVKADDNYDKNLLKSLKFNNQYDDKLFRSCIDIIEDTEEAIKEVFKNELTDNLSSQYLRLIGVLNCYYIQLNAISDLLKLFNIIDQKELIKELKQDKLIQIRNKIASHTTSYLDIKNNQKSFYQILRTSMSKSGRSIEIFNHSSRESFDLIEHMILLSNKYEKVIMRIIEERILTRNFKQEHNQWIKEQYDYVKNKP